MLKYCKIHI